MKTTGVLPQAWLVICANVVCAESSLLGSQPTTASVTLPWTRAGSALTPCLSRRDAGPSICQVRSMPPGPGWPRPACSVSTISSASRTWRAPSILQSELFAQFGGDVVSKLLRILGVFRRGNDGRTPAEDGIFAYRHEHASDHQALKDHIFEFRVGFFFLAHLWPSDTITLSYC